MDSLYKTSCFDLSFSRRKLKKIHYSLKVGPIFIISYPYKLVNGIYFLGY